jgi:Holliday junction resolvase RusA-like endonuclease
VLPVPKSWTKARRLAALEGRHPHAIKPNLDNLVKLAKDALALARLWGDDAQVVSLTAGKRYTRTGEEACTVVELRGTTVLFALWDDKGLGDRPTRRRYRRPRSPKPQ